MTVAIDIVLTIAVAAAWLATLAFFRLATPFERLHAVSLINVTSGLIVLAAFLADGLSSRSLKCALIWMATLSIGAITSHVTGRALFFREGERR